MIRKIRAIGLSSIEKNTKKKSQLLNSIIENSDKTLISKRNDLNVYEDYKYFSPNFGIIVDSKETEDGTKKINKWDVFSFSNENMAVTNLSFEKINGHLFAFCEEDSTLNELEFKVINVAEYENLGRKINLSDTIDANIGGICSSGMILFPVKKDEYGIEEHRKEDEIHQNLVKRAKSGDKSADFELIKQSAKTVTALMKRLKTEDLFTVFESYFLPNIESEGIFSVLGDIEQVEYIENNLSNESVVRLSINATNTKFSVIINEKDLVGLPSVGMRFSGTCVLHGVLKF